MLKILVPVDGSEFGARAIAQVAKLRETGAQVEVHLLNVQIPIESGHARMFVDHDELQGYYREEGLAALAGARAALDRANIEYRFHIAVGRVVDTIVRYAQEKGFDTIVLGTHGRGRLLAMALGSVAAEVLSRSPIPVMLVK